MRNRSNAAKTVEEYLSVLPGPIKELLEDLRNTIRQAAPTAEEVISFYMPAYKLNGTLVLFAAFKNHCGLYVVNSKVLEKFKNELQPYTLAKATIQFTIANPLPRELVTKIVEERIKENNGALLPKK